MFTNDRRQAERTGKYGTPRQQHLQELVTQFQNTKSEEEREKIAANLANFAYDPYNYVYLRQLNVLELFIDCLTEPNERLVEFAAGGICNAAGDPQNAKIVVDCTGAPALIGCLSSPVKNTVKYAIGGLYYLLESGVCDRRGILRPEVVELIRKYAEAGGGGGGFGNLARVLLDKHCVNSDLSKSN